MFEDNYHVLYILFVLLQRGLVSGSADHTVKFWNFELVTDDKHSATRWDYFIVYWYNLKPEFFWIVQTWLLILVKIYHFILYMQNIIQNYSFLIAGTMGTMIFYFLVINFFLNLCVNEHVWGVFLCCWGFLWAFLIIFLIYIYICFIIFLI